jgi:hypothetical protein
MDFIDDNFRWRVSVGGVSVGAVTIVPLAAKLVLNRVFVRSKRKVFHDSYLHS